MSEINKTHVLRYKNAIQQLHGIHKYYDKNKTLYSSILETTEVVIGSIAWESTTASTTTTSAAASA